VAEVLDQPKKLEKGEDNTEKGASALSNRIWDYMKDAIKGDAKGRELVPGDHNSSKLDPTSKSLEQDKWGIRNNVSALLNTGMVDQDSFPQIARVVLAKVDESGEVTKEQLAKVVQGLPGEPKITGQEAQVLAVLYRNFDKLAGKGNPKDPDEHRLTVADADRAGRIFTEEAQKQEREDARRALAWSVDGINSFGHSRLLSRDGALSRTDIEHALKLGALSDYDRKNLEFAKENFDLIGHGHALELQDFNDYSYRVDSGETPDARLRQSIWWNMRTVHESQKTGEVGKLYATANPLDSITVDAVKNQWREESTFEATLASLANANPQAIQNMIRDNGDGTYIVTFPGAKDEPIEVKAPTETELGLFDHAEAQGTWPAVLEKAYGEYLVRHHQGLNADTPQEATAESRRVGDLIGLLTGNTYHHYSLLFHSQRTIADELAKAFSSKPPKVVTLGAGLFAGYFTGLVGEITQNGFDTSVTYSITGYTPDSREAGGGWVTIRNPLAGNDDSPQGKMRIPIDYFMSNFTDIAVQD